mgnify:FL=1
MLERFRGGDAVRALVLRRQGFNQAAFDRIRDRRGFDRVDQRLKGHRPVSRVDQVT